MGNRQVYLDHSATTPVDERVFAAMQPYFSEIYGNPSAIHQWGQATEDAVEESRETIAQILNCQPKEIIFTSCGSESDNLALRGPVYAVLQQQKSVHIITSPLEHPAVYRTAQQLEAVLGIGATYLDPAKDGTIQPDSLAAALQDDTWVVSLMMANNEIGAISPIRELAHAAHQRGAYFHTDAVQAAGQLRIDVQELGVDMLSMSAHKFYGPKGVGLLYVKTGTDILPSQTGGSHEFGLRSGTHNVPLIVGMAKALELAYAEQVERTLHLAARRDQLIDGILNRIPDVELTGSASHRLPSHASFVLQNVDGNALLMHLDAQGIGASSGSACKTGNPEPSQVILGLGYGADWALGSLRLTVGIHTTAEDIDYVLDVLPKTVETLRKFSVQTS